MTWRGSEVALVGRCGLKKGGSWRRGGEGKSTRGIHMEAEQSAGDTREGIRKTCGGRRGGEGEGEGWGQAPS